jgi:hypothetical protein
MWSESEEEAMKYMTPELLARVRSLDDDVAEAARGEWQKQCEAYNQHLKEIRGELSSGARRLIRFNFHDAKVKGIAGDKAPHFSFFLELLDSSQPGGKKDLEIRYHLVRGMGTGFEVFRHKELRDDAAPFRWWLYDELDISDGKIRAMTHSILFSGGWEIQLTFYSVSCRRLDFLSLPTDEEGIIDPKLAGQWASLKDALKSF